MDKTTTLGIVGIVAGVIVAIVIALAWYAQNVSVQETAQAQDQVADDPCARLDYKIEQELRPVYDEKSATYEKELREYNKEWFPTPSYSAQIDEMYEELMRLQTELDTLINQYNAECASGV
jgi:hypothetical protein